MATITYQCDTCKRQIDLQENKNGLTVLSKCVITQGCRGRLSSVKRNVNDIRESVPTFTSNLVNYEPRRLFYSQNIRTESNVWRIEHNLSSPCIYIVYNTNGNVVPQDEYTVLEVNQNLTEIQLNSSISGIVHVIARSSNLAATGGVTAIGIRDEVEGDLSRYQISYGGVIAFGVPKFITRQDSGVDAPALPPLASVPFEVCSNQIRIEIQLKQPNQEIITCVEELNNNIPGTHPWVGWNNILVKRRKNYCVKTIQLNKLKALANTDRSKVVLVDGTTIQVTRIDYGTGELVDIPDRGLIVLLASPPYQTTDKNIGKLFDVGESVGNRDQIITLFNDEAFVLNDAIEVTYPEIQRT